MTALVSSFSRAYHAEKNAIKIFDDSAARLLLTDEEYFQISKSMAEGIGFFNPNFKGTEDEALRWIVDNQLAPTPLGRAAFAEKSLQTAVMMGARQYLIFGAGYDTFAYRQPAWAGKLQIYEIDHPATAADKRMRLEKTGIGIPSNVHFINADFTTEQWETAMTRSATFDKKKTSFCSILGLAYYLSKQAFEEMVAVLSSVLPKGSSIVFDYPDENSYTEKAGERAKKQALLAGAAREKMLASYSYKDLEKILSEHRFLIYEHLTPEEMTHQYFEAYNHGNPTHPITGFDNVNYCLAVRK